MADEKLNIKPLRDDGKCEIHELPTEGLASVIFAAMRKPGGVDACRDCLKRARGAVRRRRDATPNTE